MVMNFLPQIHIFTYTPVRNGKQPYMKLAKVSHTYYNTKFVLSQDA